MSRAPQVKLTDVYPDGQSRLIQDGAVRMRWRENAYTDAGDPQPVEMVPGEVYEMSVTLWNTSYVFAPGHSYRVAVTSSNAPRFSINPNNMLLLNDENLYTTNVTATNTCTYLRGRSALEAFPSTRHHHPFAQRSTVYHSAKYPSRLTIPVVTMDQLPEYDVIAEAGAVLGMTVEELETSPMARYVEDHFNEL